VSTEILAHLALPDFQMQSSMPGFTVLLARKFEHLKKFGAKVTIFNAADENLNDFLRTK
jgi:hypothetical protein